MWAEDAFPDVLEISTALLESRLDQDVVEQRGDIVDIRLANGRFVYEIIARDEHHQSVICVIRYREEPP